MRSRLCGCASSRRWAISSSSRSAAVARRRQTHDRPFHPEPERLDEGRVRADRRRDDEDDQREDADPARRAQPTGQQQHGGAQQRQHDDQVEVEQVDQAEQTQAEHDQDDQLRGECNGREHDGAADAPHRQAARLDAGEAVQHDQGDDHCPRPAGHRDVDGQPQHQHDDQGDRGCQHGECECGEHAHCEAVRAVAFSRDGSTLVSGGDDGIVMVWNVQVAA